MTQEFGPSLVSFCIIEVYSLIVLWHFYRPRGHMKTRIQIPRIELLNQEQITRFVSEEVLRKLYDSRPSDDIISARQECVYQFLEEALLPRLRDDGDITADWLRMAVTTFKRAFEQERAIRLGEFSLVSSIEVKLQLLRVANQIDSETKRLIENATIDLKRLILEDGDELRD